jgi:hypothetical protein
MDAPVATGWRESMDEMTRLTVQILDPVRPVNLLR